jgi:hypothetical protein
MKSAEIRRAVDEGQKIFWSNPSYEVIKGNSPGEYFIRCLSTGHCISLTHADGITLNGAENEFFIAPS